jgi:hypothetical protein
MWTETNGRLHVVARLHAPRTTTSRPAVPVDKRVGWLTICSLEVRTLGMSHRNQCGLSDLIEGNAENLGRSLFKKKVKSGEAATQTTQACCQHEIPRGRKNRTPQDRLKNRWQAVCTALNTRDEWCGAIDLHLGPRASCLLAPLQSSCAGKGTKLSAEVVASGLKSNFCDSCRFQSVEPVTDLPRCPCKGHF